MSDPHEALHPAVFNPWAAVRPDVSACVEGDYHD